MYTYSRKSVHSYELSVCEDIIEKTCAVLRTKRVKEEKKNSKILKHKLSAFKIPLKRYYFDTPSLSSRCCGGRFFFYFRPRIIACIITTVHIRIQIYNFILYSKTTVRFLYTHNVYQNITYCFIFIFSDL